MTSRLDDTDHRFDELQAERILKRAVEIDARLATAVSERTLRQIAAELQISDLAVSRAIAEEESGAVAGVWTVRKPRRGGLTEYLISVGLAGVGFVTGALVRASSDGRFIGDPDALTINSALMLGVLVTGTAFFVNEESPIKSILIRSSLLWSAFVTGWSVAHGGVHDDLVSLGIVAAFISSAASALIVLWRERVRRDHGSAAPRES